MGRGEGGRAGRRRRAPTNLDHGEAREELGEEHLQRRGVRSQAAAGREAVDRDLVLVTQPLELAPARARERERASRARVVARVARQVDEEEEAEEQDEEEEEEVVVEEEAKETEEAEDDEEEERLLLARHGETSDGVTGRSNAVARRRRRRRLGKMRALDKRRRVLEREVGRAPVGRLGGGNARRRGVGGKVAAVRGAVSREERADRAQGAITLPAKHDPSSPGGDVERRRNGTRSVDHIDQGSGLVTRSGDGSCVRHRGRVRGGAQRPLRHRGRRCRAGHGQSVRRHETWPCRATRAARKPTTRMPHRTHVHARAPHATNPRTTRNKHACAHTHTLVRARTYARVRTSSSIASCSGSVGQKANSSHVVAAVAG